MTRNLGPSTPARRRRPAPVDAGQAAMEYIGVLVVIAVVLSTVVVAVRAAEDVVDDAVAHSVCVLTSGDDCGTRGSGGDGSDGVDPGVFAGTILGTVDALIAVGAGYLSRQTAIRARALGPSSPPSAVRSVADDIIDDVVDRVRREQRDADRRCEEIPLLEGLCRSDEPDPDPPLNPDPADPGNGDYEIGQQPYRDCHTAGGDTLLVEAAASCSRALADWSAIDGTDGPDLGPTQVHCGSGITTSGPLIRVAVVADLTVQTCDQARASTDVALDVGSDPTP